MDWLLKFLSFRTHPFPYPTTWNNPNLLTLRDTVKLIMVACQFVVCLLVACLSFAIQISIFFRFVGGCLLILFLKPYQDFLERRGQGFFICLWIKKEEIYKLFRKQTISKLLVPLELMIKLLLTVMGQEFSLFFINTC